MIFLCFILTLVFYATTPAIAMDDDLPVNFHKRKGFNHSEETHLKRTKLTKVLNFGKETQLAKSIKETPISTIAWVMDQYANVFGLKGDQNFCSFKKTMENLKF